MTRTAARQPGTALDRVALLAERALRLAGEGRVAVALLLLVGAANAVAAIAPQLRWILDSPPYVALIGGVLLSGIAAVAVRAPAAWREWRRPSAIAGRSDTLERTVDASVAATPEQRVRIVAALRGLGYRTAEQTGVRWAVHGTRRGWSRFAAIASHLAIVLMVVGAAMGSAFATETVFSLLPGEQALLGEPRPGFTAAVRLDEFNGEFGADGRPRRLDTSVTFLKDGRAVRSQVLRVNEPGGFGGYLVHGWTYGPAATVRVVDIEGRPLMDAGVPLDATADGRPSGFVDVPQLDVTLGLTLADADRNLVRATLAGSSGTIDSVLLTPGEEERLGDVTVMIRELTSYVTFMSRSDPGIVPLFAGAGLLVISLAVAYYLPRRRCSVRLEPNGLLVQVRGERFDGPLDELDRVAERVRAAL